MAANPAAMRIRRWLNAGLLGMVLFSFAAVPAEDRCRVVAPRTGGKFADILAAERDARSWRTPPGGVLQALSPELLSDRWRTRWFGPSWLVALHECVSLQTLTTTDGSVSWYWKVWLGYVSVVLALSAYVHRRRVLRAIRAVHEATRE